jgi:hypothetical protein
MDQSFLNACYDLARDVRRKRVGTIDARVKRIADESRAFRSFVIVVREQRKATAD